MIRREAFLSLAASSGGPIVENGTVRTEHGQSMCHSSGIHGDHCNTNATSRDLWTSIRQRTLMTETPHRRRTDAWRLKPIKMAFIILTLIFFAVLVGFGKVIVDVKHNSNEVKAVSLTTALLVRENSQRIKEIQKSRVDSCKRTYNGIREVFLPFFPPPPRTPQQIDNLEKFNTTINNLAKACIKQTKTKPVKKGVN
jgi:hypothetical protein